MEPKSTPLKTRLGLAGEVAGSERDLQDTEILSERQLRWRRFRRSRTGPIALGVILLLYAMALFAGILAPNDPRRPDVDHVHAPPMRPHLFDESGKMRLPFVYPLRMEFGEEGIERIYAADRDYRLPLRLFVRGDPYYFLGVIPTSLHFVGVDGGRWYPLGTDRMGRCLFSRMLYGARISLTIGLVGVALTLLIGTVIGTASGYFGGMIDDVVQRAIELLMSFPAIPLWMALAAALPPNWGPVKVYFGIVTILSLIGWGGLARQIRGMVLSTRERDYIRAARAFGASDRYLIFRHLIPSCQGYLIVMATLMLPATILGETALSFLGLGIRPPMLSWGVLLEEAQHVRVLLQFPWLLLPAVPVLVTVVSFNLLGDALRDALEG